MKYLYLFLSLLLFSCNSIPNKSIFEKLSPDELSGIIKKDSLFAEFYEDQVKSSESLSEIEKAKYYDITYRNLYEMMTFVKDTASMNPLWDNWTIEWENEFGKYENMVDSVLLYWSKYKENNSLNKFVKIEFAEIDKEYYSYSSHTSDNVKNINLGFKLTPLEGRIEQLKFNYRFSAKINNIYGDKNYCISTTPFSNSITRYWEVDYTSEKTLKNTTTSNFIRDYDIKIEITDIRKDGNNYSIDDLDIPESVNHVFSTDSLEYPYLYQSYKNDVIIDVLKPDYKGENEYVLKKLEELLAKKFPHEFAYMKFVSEK